MLSKVKQYITRHQLLSDGLYIVALSGGADSVALLCVLKALRYRIEAAHCNFKLRGAESERDERFCEQVCKEHGVSLHKVHFETREYAALHGVSIEMAARELRYSYFERLRVAIGAEDIVVAHHRDDNIETLLLNLIRGTGIHGLTGMKSRNGHIVRPLLCVSRDEIEDYLQEIQQGYITDSSNLVDDVQRNKVRLHVVPVLREINPAALENIQESMEHFVEAEKVYNESISKSASECMSENTLSLSALRRQSSPESTLYEILRGKGIGSKLVSDIYGNLDAPVGRHWESGVWTVAKDRGSLIIDKTPESCGEQRFPEKGVYCFGECRVEIATYDRSDDFHPSRASDRITIDADKVTFPLTLRDARAGDAFRPYGMKGRKLVSDYLTDEKVDYFARKRQLVLTDGHGSVIWVVGRRVSDQVSVRGDTIKILEVRYSNGGC